MEQSVSKTAKKDLNISFEQNNTTTKQRSREQNSTPEISKTSERISTGNQQRKDCSLKKRELTTPRARLLLPDVRKTKLSDIRTEKTDQELNLKRGSNTTSDRIKQITSSLIKATCSAVQKEKREFDDLLLLPGDSKKLQGDRKERSYSFGYCSQSVEALYLPGKDCCFSSEISRHKREKEFSVLGRVRKSRHDSRTYDSGNKVNLPRDITAKETSGELTVKISSRKSSYDSLPRLPLGKVNMIESGFWQEAFSTNVKQTNLKSRHRSSTQ